MKRRAVVAFAIVPLASCATIAGLEDHELSPLQSDAAAGGDAQAEDASSCVACASGYACTDGRCGNEVTEVAASSTHACALLRGGEVWCWGKSQLGALGVSASTTPLRCGNYACRPTPALVVGVANVQHIALADDATCVVLMNGTVSCWGRNARGALGHDPATDPMCPRDETPDAGSSNTDPCTTTPSLVATGNVAVAEIVGGSGGACTRAVDGSVSCWGDDYFAEGGVFPAPLAGLVATPARISGIAGTPTAIAMSGAYGHGCAIGFFGNVYCWGSNFAGELGHPTAQSGDDACIFGIACNPGAQGAMNASGTAVSVGQKSSCALHGDGTVTCWGANDSAQLGNGASVDPDAHPMPAAVSGLANIVSIEQRFNTGFAIDGAAHVWSWGQSTNGALGVATASIACAAGTCVPKPVMVPALAGAVQIASASAGGVALKSDGTVWTWGLNDVGQLGHVPGAGGDITCPGGPCRESPSQLQGLP